MPTTAGGDSTTEAINRLNDGIGKMNDMLDLMLDVFEKRSRQNTPGSLYSGRNRGVNKRLENFDYQNLKRFEQLSKKEVDSFSKEIEERFKSLTENLSREIDVLNEKISTETDAAKKAELIRSRDSASEKRDDAQRKLSNSSNPDFLEQYWTNERYNPAASAAITDFHTTPERLARYGAENERYRERTEKLNNVSTAIAHSGLGNTAIGRVAQNAVNRQHNMNSLGNFGSALSNGGMAHDIGASLFGVGKAGKAASSALSFFGKGVGMIGKVLGGPFMTVLSLVIDGLKALAETYNEWQKLTAEFIRYQTEMEKIAYEEAKQKKIQQTEIEVEQIGLKSDLALKMLEMQSENILEATDMQLKALTKSFEIGTGALVKGVNQTAYEATTAAIEMGAAKQKYEKHAELRETQRGLFANKRMTEAEQKIASSMAEQYVTEVNAETQRMTASSNLENKQIGYAAKAANDLTSLNLVGAAGNAMMAGRDAEKNTTTEVEGKGNVNPVTGKAVDVETYKAHGVNDIKDVRTGGRAMTESAIMGALGSDASGLIEENAARVENAVEAIKRDADYVKVNTELQYKKQLAEVTAQTALAEKQADTQTKVAEKQIEAAETIQKNWLAVTQSIEEWQSKFEKTFNDIGQSLGMNSKGKMMQFQQSQFEIIKSVAESFGMTDEDVAAIQKGYTDNTGRNGVLSKMDMRQLAALGTNMGDNGLAAQYAGEMDIFNHSVEESVDLLGDALNDVNRIGLNGRKFTKDVVNNLKLAQKYNFKGGIQGFMNMAKWAEKTRFNIASLSGMLDKVQEGGLEGVIQQSAGFQVLGGHAAMNSDPLGMMFDAWADPEAYAKRMQDMTKGFGTVDAKTGETKFNINESMQMAQIAKLQGRSVDEVRGEVMDRNKREFVKNNLTDYQKQNLTDEEKDYLGTVAKYNAKEQRYEAKVYNKETGQVEVKDVKDLTSADLENVMSEDHDERMETWVADIASVVKKMDAEKVWESADVASSTYQNTLNSFNERLTTMHESYLNTRQETIDNITSMQSTIEESVTGFLQQYANNVKGNTDDVSEQMGKIKESANDIAGTLKGVGDVISAAASYIDKKADSMMGDWSSHSGFATENAAKKIHGSNGQKENVSRQEISGLKQSSKDPRNMTPKEFVQEYTGFLMGTPYNDAVVGSGDESKGVLASDVTRINDGSLKLAKTNKNDFGIFAKSGGPFDKLFDGIFGKVNSIYDAMSDKIQGKSKVIPDALKMMKDAWDDPFEYAKRVQDMGRTVDSQKDIKNDVNVNINGKLLLDSGKQQIDLLVLLRENPDLVRKITEAVINQMSSNANGGKYEMFSNRYYR